MDVRNEMRRTMKAFGKPLKIISKNKEVNGAGIFQRILKKPIEKTTDNVSAVGYIRENKYSLWLFDYEQVDCVDKVMCEKRTYDTVSGDYDSELGCWRLVVKEIDNETI